MNSCVGWEGRRARPLVPVRWLRLLPMVGTGRERDSYRAPNPEIMVLSVRRTIKKSNVIEQFLI